MTLTSFNELHSSPTPLGLIAGEGELPKLVARGARAAGRAVAVVALRGCADPALRELADTFRWRGIVQLGRWIRVFKRAGCREVVMAGRVRKA
ncbi:MAG: LpxI family protein, partial [Phycisphaerae bacterium]|nr:LpxI family protein [Phycisphaerae bacterium]